MKKLTLLFLTFFTLNVFGQDSTSTENTSDLLANKIITLIEETHDKIAVSNLDISTFKMDIDWKKITKFSTIYGAVNGGN